MITIIRQPHPDTDKGVMRNVTHKPYPKPGRKDRKLEEVKQALHEFEEKKGDWAMSR